MNGLSKIRILTIPTFIKNSLRNFSRNQENVVRDNEEIQKPKKKPHIYKETYTEEELITKLAESMVYNKNDIIVMNKPYGIGKAKPEFIRNYYKPATFNECYLNDVLPYLAKKLGYKQLHIAKCPERYASGVLLLTTTEEALKRIKVGIELGKARGVSVSRYLAVTVSTPKPEEIQKTFAIKTPENDKSVPEITDKWPKWSNFKKRRMYVVVRWKHKVLSSSSYGSLVKIELSKSKHNALRLYLATKCYAPVLGDHIFGSSVKEVMGVLLPVTQSATSDNVSQLLDSKLQDALHLSKKELEIIPAHVHLHSLLFPLSKSEDFFVSVPPPESFLWTCRQLKLDTEFI